MAWSPYFFLDDDFFAEWDLLLDLPDLDEELLPLLPLPRRALRSGTGRIRAGGVDRAVTFRPIDPGEAAVQDDVDAAYHEKYDRYGARIVNTVVGPQAHRSTLRLDPR